jgi:arsenate reductase
MTNGKELDIQSQTVISRLAVGKKLADICRCYRERIFIVTRILVLCTGNSARSQIAEGLVRHLGGKDVEVLSAGTHPAGVVHPFAIAAMKERGIDISAQTSKTMILFEGQQFDFVITVCDDAQQECPHFSGAKKQLHWSTPDPSFVSGSPDERLDAFRKTVAALESRISTFLSSAQNKKATS